MVPTLAPVEEDDGYVSPVFDLPTDSDDEESTSPPPAKRAKNGIGSKLQTGISSLAEEEELALRLLRR